MSRNYDELFDSLEKAFKCEGIVGGDLMPVLKAERAFEAEVLSAHRKYFWAIDCFLGFWFATLQAAERILRVHGGDEHYHSVLLAMMGDFRRYRSAETILLRGYPLSAYGLMRDAFDRAIIMGAVANGGVSPSAVLGLEKLGDGGTNVRENDLSARAISSSRKAAEARALTYMKHGLSGAHAKRIHAWYEIFHLEVHGNLLTNLLHGRSFLMDGAALPLLPSADRVCNEWYLAASLRVAWLWLRVLPFLQTKLEPFDEAWAQKWRILDRHLRLANEPNSVDAKPLALAFEHLVDQKFSFDPEHTFYDCESNT